MNQEPALDKVKMLELLSVAVQMKHIKVFIQILDETDCISHSTNTLGKGMNPIILLPAMGKL